MRVTENRAKELAILPEIDAAAVANALWHTRCALAVAPQDTTAAFPGVRCYTAVQATVARRPPLRPGTGGDVLASAACLSTTDSHVCGAGGHDVSRVFNESTLDRRIHLVQAVPVSQRRQRGNGTGSHGFRSNRARQQTLNEPATFYYNLCIYDVKNEYSCAARAATVRVRFHCVPALPLPLPPEFWANLGYGERERPGRGCPDTVLQRLTLRFWGGMQ